MVTRPSGIVINPDRIAFSGIAVIGKTPQPLQTAVVRDEGRDEDGRVSHLRYRVSDIRRVEAAFEPIFPGTNRRPFARPDDDREGTLVELSLDQIDDRIASNRLQQAIPYVARRVHIRGKQVNQLLCLSQREINGERGRLLREFRDATTVAIEEEQGDALREVIAAELEEELGTPPTPQQIEERFEQRVKKLVAEAEKDFVVEEQPSLLEAALTTLDRFDLSPHELAGLHRRNILLLRAFQLIEIRHGARQGTLYILRSARRRRDQQRYVAAALPASDLVVCRRSDNRVLGVTRPLRSRCGSASGRG